MIINLGLYFDVSNIEKRTDLLLCLGGGKGERIKKTIEVYKKYSDSKPHILLTENNDELLNNKINLLKDANIPISNVSVMSSINNTYTELKKAHKLMINRNYKSVNIISDEPHTRRIKMLIDNFIYDKKDSISYNIVGSNVKWWNKKYYYKNKNRAIYFVVHESIKMLHNFFYYSYITIFNIDNVNTNKMEEKKKDLTKMINKAITYIINF